MSKTKTLTVTEHINGPQREFSLYTIYNRAIPSLIDGLKIVQRKSVYTATKFCANKKIKTVGLVGHTISSTFYHHGDASLGDAINKLAAPWNNNAPILNGHGAFGSRLVKSCGAVRYTSVSLSQNFKKYFVDNDIIEHDETDTENPQPFYYLPLIPWVLVNGIQGIAVGFATHIARRNPEELAAVCREYVRTGHIVDRDTKLKPWFDNFTGCVWLSDNGKQWNVDGRIERASPTKVNVVDIPPQLDRAKYIARLDGLQEEGKIVKYKDSCNKKGFKFEVTLPRGKMKMTDAELISYLKLRVKFTENLTVIDENGNLAIFDDVFQIVAQFCDFRLAKYTTRYKHRIARDTKLRDDKLEVKRFIGLVIDGAFTFKGKSKSDMISELKSLSFSDSIIEKVLRLQIHSLNPDYEFALAGEAHLLEQDIERWKSTDPTVQYQIELKEVE